MTVQVPISLSAAEERLVAQLESAGAAEAAASLRASGLPTRRVEAYHYTDLKALLRDVPPPAEAAPATGAPALALADAYRLPIVNGVVTVPEGAPAGVSVRKAGVAPVVAGEDVLVRLNAALAAETLEIVLSGAVEPIIHVDRRIEGEAAHAASAVRIVVAAGSSATIVETVSGSEAAHLANSATALSVGEGAQVTHVMVDLSARQATHFASIACHIEAEANFKSLIVHAGAHLARTQLFAEFAGRGAHGDLLGLNLVDTGQHADITLDLSHAVADTTSTETYKQIGRGQGRAVFQGKIVVARDAQKTDAQMMTQGLMLSDEVEIFAKPELEIFADDVVCAHGATCGALDTDALFYLMSRGVPEAEAQTMLVRAFLQEVVEAVENPHVAEALSGLVEGWLAKGAP